MIPQPTATMRASLGLISLLWLQLFVALVPTWQNGEYYAYGWFVPLLAACLAWRRWNLLSPPPNKPPSGSRAGLMAVTLLLAAAALVIPLRLIGMADPGWRPPLLLHVLIVCTLTHWFLLREFGRKTSLGMLPVTIFALSCVPYPWQVEKKLVLTLTESVMHITRECFLLAGQPVELQGTRLTMAGEVVDVTGGCSGIRSLQSLVMVALFFGEFFFLSLPRRSALILAAAISAVALNTLRAWWLASIHFNRGPEAAAAAHDPIGHLTFALSAALLWLVSYFLLQAHPNHLRVLRRVQHNATTPSTQSDL